mgnify:CR=1 FL=1
MDWGVHCFTLLKNIEGSGQKVCVTVGEGKGGKLFFRQDKVSVRAWETGEGKTLILITSPPLIDPFCDFGCELTFFFLMLAVSFYICSSSLYIPFLHLCAC